MPTPTLAIHAGAGLPDRGALSAEHEAEAQRGLLQALRSGQEVLAAGGSALDAAVAAVRTMEEDPQFNAGRGAVLCADGTVQHDASLMEGTTHRAGAVAGLTGIRSPILTARAIMEDTPHVLLVGEQARLWAAARGLEQRPPQWFLTELRQAQLARLQEQQATALDHEGGTVGAVARDAAGHLAAATSTGGMTNTLPGRVGDSAVIGAGTWADDRTCAVSGTGHGEAFIRVGAGRRIADLVELAGLSLAEACERTLAEIAALGAQGGVIALGRTGPPRLPFTSGGMFRAWLDDEGRPRTAIWP